MNQFDLYLQISEAELTWEIDREIDLPIEFSEFLINPRRLRGSDFLMRWSQGRWSEEIVIKSLNQTKQFGVIPYGPSTVAPEDPKELEAFFEKMDAINQEGKRPDLLLYDKGTYEVLKRGIEQQLGDTEKIGEIPSSQLSDVISKAIAAIEVENSLWITEKMPGFGKPLLRYKRGKNKGKLKFPGTIPTIIVKEEDLPGLVKWQDKFKIPIYVVHIFYDRGYFIKFDDILSLLNLGELAKEVQRYTNPDGTAASPKVIVKVPYTLCKDFGIVSDQQLVCKTFVDKNGKVMTYATFSEGNIKLSADVFDSWACDS